MNTRGKIQWVKGDSATIVSGDMDGCFGCMNIECKNRGVVFTAINPLGLPIKAGQLVEIENTASGSLLHAVLLFVPLLMGFLAGYVLTGIIHASDAARAAAGASGLLIGGTASYFFRKRYPLKGSPRISGILEGL